MKLFPKWRDYKKYTIPNKLAVLGFYLAALSLVVYLITLIPFQRFKKVETVYECKPIFNEEYSNIKIIILPFNELYKNTGYDVGYDIKTRLDYLNEKDKLNLTTYYLDFNITQNFTIDSAKYLLQHHNANILIYGSYSTNIFSQDSDRISLNFITDEIIKTYEYLEYDQLNQPLLQISRNALSEGRITGSFEAMIYYISAFINNRMGNINISQQHINESIKRDSANEKGYYLKGLNYYLLKKWKDAINEYSKAININSEFAVCYLNRGNIYYLLGNIIEAENDIRSASKIDSTFILAFYNLGEIKYKSGENDSAIFYYTKVTKLDSTIFFAYLRIGMAHAKENRHKKAIELLSKAISINPSSQIAYLNKASSELVEGDLETALQDVEKAFKLDSNNPLVYNIRSLIEYKQKLYNEALNDCNMAINIDSTKSRFYYARGEVYYELERYRDAYNDFNSAIYLEDSNGSFYIERSKTMVKLGFDRLRICADLDKAISLGYKDQINHKHYLKICKN